MPERRFDLDASSLRADLSDAGALAAALAAKLEEALPAQTTVKRRSTRLLSREKRVEHVEVAFGEESFALTLTGTGTGSAARATRARTVGGIVIRREELPVNAWLDALGRALGAEAERSEAARLALERLLD